SAMSIVRIVGGLLRVVLVVWLSLRSSSLLPRITLPVISAIRGWMRIARIARGILPCSIVIGAAIALWVSVVPVVIPPVALVGSGISVSRILPAGILLMI